MRADRPLQREGTPNDAAEAVAYLASERARYITGIVLTVDGGTSIGKPSLFTLVEDFTVDTHVVIIRPKEISPLAVVYLLASPLGQMQFRRAESGSRC